MLHGPFANTSEVLSFVVAELRAPFGTMLERRYINVLHERTKTDTSRHIERLPIILDAFASLKSVVYTRLSLSSRLRQSGMTAQIGMI